MSDLKFLPNAISILRMASVPLLAWLAWGGFERAFTVVLIIAGLSDWFDGWLARHFGWVSRTGALLDSIADMSLILVVLYGIVRLHPEVFVEHGWIIWTIVAAWLIVNLAALMRYCRPASFHTSLGRAGFTSFVIFVLVLFLHGFVPWVLMACGVVCLVAAAESLLLVILIRNWSPDLRGGLIAVLQARRRLQDKP